MKAFVLENPYSPTWERGWGNGYVALPKEHPYYGLGIDELIPRLKIHGGVTFADYAANLTDAVPAPDDWLVVGWDTSWRADTRESWPMERVVSENASLLEQLEKVAATQPLLNRWLSSIDPGNKQAGYDASGYLSKTDNLILVLKKMADNGYVLTITATGVSLAHNGEILFHKPMFTIQNVIEAIDHYLC